MAEKNSEVLQKDSSSVKHQLAEKDGKVGIADDCCRRLYYLQNTLDVKVTLKSIKRDDVVIAAGEKKLIDALLNVDAKTEPPYSVIMNYSHGGAETIVSTRASLQATGEGLYIEIKVEGAQTGENIYLSKMSSWAQDWHLKYVIRSDRIDVYNCGILYDSWLFKCDLKEATGLSADSDK